jgi:hypothetical protein
MEVKTVSKASDANPDEPCIIWDNIEAIKVLTDHGLLHMMEPKPGANTTYHSFDTKDHWCLASKHIEHATDHDNGYMIVMLPKNKTSQEDASHFFAECIAENSEGVSFGIKPIAPLKAN